MSASKMLRMSAVAAVASSGFSILAAPVAVAGTLVPVLPDLVLMVLLLVTDLLIFLALIGLYGGQAEEIGTTGLSGFVLAEVGVAVTLLVVEALFIMAPLRWYRAVQETGGSVPPSADSQPQQ